MSRQIINNGSSGSTQWGANADAMNANFSELYALISSGNLVLVDSLNKLPPALGGVIAPQDNKVYMILVHLDLLGARLENTTGIFAIIGTTSETSSITSTGLSGAALITARYSIPMLNITISPPVGAHAFDLDGAGNPTAAIDWKYVNVGRVPTNTSDNDIRTIGTIKNYSNCTLSYIAWLNCVGGVVDGAFGTFAASDMFASGDNDGTILTIPATASFSRRFRINDSSLVSFAGGKTIDFSTSASVPNDSYILNNVNFSGGGNHIVGVQHNDNKANFSDCSGISNSATLAHATMNGNVTATTILATSTPVKVAGNFTLKSSSQRFELDNNELVYVGTIKQRFKIRITGSLTSGNNNQIGIYVTYVDFDTGVPAIIVDSENYTTTNGAGRSEVNEAETVLELKNGDRIYASLENITAIQNITMNTGKMFIDPFR